MKLKDTMLKSRLCNFRGVFIILKGKKTTAGNISAVPVTKDKQVMKQKPFNYFFYPKDKNLYRVLLIG